MAKLQKEIIAKAINKIVIPLGGSFRWRTSQDQLGWNGMFIPTTKTIVLKSTVGPRTLAHELAHLTQFNLRGQTKCEYSNPYGKPLAMEHYALQKQWTTSLKANGVYQLLQN